MSKEVVWTNYGLDGAGSYLLLKWLRSKDIEVHTTTPKRFRDDFIRWQADNGINTYSRVFILNLDLSKCIDIVDTPKCVIIDNHQTHIERKGLYSNAKTAIVEATSTTRLLFRVFKSELLKTLTPYQIKLISLIDDYISTNYSYSESKTLNAAYWCVTGDKLQKFVHDFNDGYRGLNKHQRNAIYFYFKKLAQIMSNLDIFEGVLPYKHKNYKIVSTFADGMYDEITQHLIETHQAEIVFLVNIPAKTVFIRKSKKCDLSITKLAEKLCDGGGSEYFAGGDLTDRFLTFCKTLRQVC